VSELNAQSGWVPQSSGTRKYLAAVFFTDANTGTVVGDSGTILHTTDSGGTWASQSSGTNYPLTGVHFTDANTGTAVGGGSDSLSLSPTAIILRTTNGGGTWTSQSTVLAHNRLIGVYFTDANTGTAVGRVGTILRTTNGGTSWTSQPSETPGDLAGVCFTDANTGIAVGSYATTGNGVILRTTNGGSTWWNQPLDPANGTTRFPGLHGVSFSDTNTGTAVGSSGTIFRTTNGGAVWKSQSSPTTSWLHGVHFTDADTGTAVGGAYDSFLNPFAIILRTTDGGATWTNQSSGTKSWLNGVHFTDANTGTAVGDLGTILRTTTGGETWVSVDQEPDAPRQFTLGQNYPNPFNPSTTIRYGLPHRCQVTLTVFNTLGQRVALLQNGEQEAGYHDVQFNGSGLSSGVYFYRLRAGDLVETKRLLLIR
jgi:photosystem II stability/assembly factor-like uncharacterized protein